MRRWYFSLLLIAGFGCRDTMLTGPSTEPSAAVLPGTLLFETPFPLNESPIAEGGAWANGRQVGLDWSDVRTNGQGRAWGLQTNAQYRDATALLTGAWPANQYAQAVVFTDLVGPPRCHQEVELRLRSALAPHVNRGYEIYWKARKDGNSALSVAVWYGPHGSYRRLWRGLGTKYGVATGDTVRASIVGNTIRVYKNGVLQATVVDATWQDGAPGMGFNLNNIQPGCAGTNAHYGYKGFQAGSL